MGWKHLAGRVGMRVQEWRPNMWVKINGAGTDTVYPRELTWVTIQGLTPFLHISGALHL